MGLAKAHNIVFGTLSETDTCEFDISSGVAPNPPVCHTKSSPASLPIIVAAWPPGPLGAVPVDPCVATAANVTVAAGATLSLSPGCYRDIRVNAGGTLNLSAGSYVFRTLVLLAGATLNGNGATANVQSSTTTEAGVSLNDVTINTPGTTTGQSETEFINIGRSSLLQNVILYAPTSAITLQSGTTVLNSKVVANFIVVEPIIVTSGTPVVPPPVPLTDFRDVRRPNDINIGPDLGGTTHQALNFTGTTGAAGDTWITVYDPAPNPPPVTFGSVSLSVDVLIHTFNNKKGAGLLALYNEAPSKKGLALTLYSAGNTDTLVLATVDQAGKLVTLKTVSLGAAITENVWFRVSMDVTVEAGLVSVVGTVFRHGTPTDPNSALGTQVGVPLTFSGTLGDGALVGVDPTGEVGILAAAVSTANSSSVTNITIEP